MNWKFKKGVEVYTEEFWYDLTLGGYLCPEKLLIDEEQIKKLNEAIEIVSSFESAINEIMEDGENESDE